MIDLDSLYRRYMNKVVMHRLNQCWLWNGAKNEFGYGKLYYANHPKRTTRAHRLSFLLFQNWLPEYVLHTCDNPECTNPSHLYAGTMKQNTQDSIKRNRFKTPPVKWAENHPRHKLSSKQVKIIRRLYRRYSRNHSSYVLAKQFKVDPSQITNIARHKQRNSPADLGE